MTALNHHSQALHSLHKLEHRSPNASPICSICIQIKKCPGCMPRSDFFSITSYMLILKKKKITFYIQQPSQSTLQTQTTINFTLQFKKLGLEPKIGIPFVNMISTHTSYLAFLLPSLYVIIIVSLNSSYQLLRQKDLK